MQFTITIPRGWGHPKYTIGQRTKQGLVVGIEYIPTDSLLASELGGGWHYGLLADKRSKEITYYAENELEILSAHESDEQILAEIDEYLNQVAILQAQLGINLHIKTPFGDIKPGVSTPVPTQNISRRTAA